MQAEVALAQLDPIGQHVVVLADLIGELADIIKFLLIAVLLQATGFVDDSVNERSDAVDEGYLRPLLEVETFAVFNPETPKRQFLTPLLKQIVRDILSHMPTVHVVEQPEREQQQYDGYHHGAHHDVKLDCRLFILVGTRLQLTILTGGLLKVEIKVTVIVALRLVVDSRISHTQLFADGGHQVRGLMDQ